MPRPVVRTCVGCRATADRRELIRLVRDPDGTIVPDPSGRAPGRGAYVHRDDTCVRSAIGSGGLARALRGGLERDGAARLLRAVRVEDDTQA